MNVGLSFGRPGGLRRAPLRCGSLPRRNRRGKGTEPFAALALVFRQEASEPGFEQNVREGSQWKAHSHEARMARTCNGEPDGARLVTQPAEVPCAGTPNYNTS